MRSDPIFEKVSALVEPDVARMLARQEARTAGHDRAELDETAGVLSFYSGRSLLWRAQARLVATHSDGGMSLSGGSGILRWVWGEGSVTNLSRRRIDAIYREALHFKVDLILRNVPLATRAEADRIVNVAVKLGSGDGVYARESAREVAYFALFDMGEGERQVARSLAPPAGGSAPPPPTGRRASMPDALASTRSTIMPSVAINHELASPLGSIPPPRVPSEPGQLSVPPPTSAKPLTLERARPAASAALAAFVAKDASFWEAALVVTLELSGAKARFSVQLVAIGSDGRLAFVDTTQPVAEAVTRMVTEAREAGELGWRTLILRMTPKSGGGGVNLTFEMR